MTTRSMYIISALMNKAFKRLNNFIPPTLFVETNLPPVIVYRQKDLGGNYVIDVIDVSLALSMYLPGRPLFRTGGWHGIILPIRDLYGNIICTCIRRWLSRQRTIESLYETVSINVPMEAVYHGLPEEYHYILEQFLGIKGHPNLYIRRPIAINPYTFYKPARPATLHWIRWYSGGMSSLIIDHEYFVNKKLKYIHFVSKSSISYSRYSSHILNLNPIPDNRIMKLNSTLYNLFNIRDLLNYGTCSVLRYIYAIDYCVKSRGFIVKDTKCVDEIIDNGGLKEDSLKPRSQGTFICGSKVYGYSIIGNRILCTVDYGTPKPIILGYQVKNTKYLVYIRPSLLDVVDEFLDYIKDYINNDCVSNKKHTYILWSINQLLFNMLKYSLSHDLGITFQLSRCLKFSLLVDNAFTYNDLYSDEKIIDLVYEYLMVNSENNVGTFIDKILNIIREFNANLYSKSLDPKAYIIKLILSGSREIKCGMLYDDEKFEQIYDGLVDRLKRILSMSGSRSSGRYTANWINSSISSILIHTLNHHLINIINERSRISTSYLSEIYDISATDIFNLGIYEKASGGIEAIDTTLDYWVKDKSMSVLIEDLVLKLGKCSIGTPEDIIYFMYMGKSNIRNVGINLRKNVLDAIKELGLIITPLEFKETFKLHNAFIEESKLLSKLVGGINEYTLIRDIINLRSDAENYFKRFVGSNELLAYLFKNIKRYNALRRIIVELGTRYITPKEETIKVLSKYYGTNDPIELINKLVDDIYDTLNDITNNRLYNVLIQGGNDKKTFRNVIIDLARITNAALRKLYLKTCNNVCGLCYLNTISCGRFSAPWVQEKTLSRRLLKIFASWLVKRNPSVLSRVAREPLSDILGKIVVGEPTYIYRSG